MGEGEREWIGEGLASTGCDGEGRGVGVGVGVKVAEGDGVGDAVVEGVGSGVAGRGIGAGVGVKVAGGDGVSIGALEGVALGVAGWRRQSNSSKTTAIAALSLQKSREDRSEKRLIGGEPEYLQAPRSPQPKGRSAKLRRPNQRPYESTSELGQRPKICEQRRLVGLSAESFLWQEQRCALAVSVSARIGHSGASVK